MKSRDAIIVGAVIVILGGIMVKRKLDKDGLRAIFADWAGRAGIDPDLVDAMLFVESDYDPSAVNLTGRDGARGGSYGPTQISAKTAAAYGYTGDPAEFARDASLAAQWTMKILQARPGGAPTSVDDVAAWWNAGRTSMAKVPATSSAWTYRQNLEDAYKEITA